MNNFFTIQLFADDIGILLQTDKTIFLAIRKVIAQYEQISGAQLNLDKSTLIQLDSFVSPNWFSRVGCHVAQPDAIFCILAF